MKKTVYLAIVILGMARDVSAYSAGMSAHPSFIHTPKIIYDQPYSIPTQSRTSRSVGITDAHMIVRPIVQPTPLHPHIDAHRVGPTFRPSGPEIITEQQRAELLHAEREREIMGYTHMYATSDTYNDIQLK